MTIATAAGVAAKSALSKTAAQSIATLGKGMAKKGAAEVGQGFSKLADCSRDFLAASMAFQEVGKAFKCTGPAMSLLSAQFTSGTMESRMQLTLKLLELVQSPGGEAAMNNFILFVNEIFRVGGSVVDLINTIANSDAIAEFNRAVAETLRVLHEMGNTLETVFAQMKNGWDQFAESAASTWNNIDTWVRERITHEGPDYSEYPTNGNFFEQLWFNIRYVWGF